MIRPCVLRAAVVVVLALRANAPRVAGASSFPLDLESQREPSSSRPSWPVAWFHRREDSSVSHLSRERHERDGNERWTQQHGGRADGQRSGHTSPAGGTRVASPGNSRSRHGLETRSRPRGHHDDDGHSRTETSFSRHRVANGGGGEFIDSRIARPTSTTKMNGSSSGSSSTSSSSSSSEAREGRSESEKLTAVAVAKYEGTRAVAYAGYHHQQRNFDDNPAARTRETSYGLASAAEATTYTKHHAGRRVCTRQTPNSIAHHVRSRQYRLVYTELTASTFLCCPGWSQVSRTSYGCNRPTCRAACLNGGVCGPHGKCNCPKGFTGTQCQTDVDECLTEKPCGQICINVPGSYKCHCRHGFHIQPDGQSCRKNGSDGTAFEAHDLENDYGYTTNATTETPRRTTPATRDTDNEVGEGNDQDYDIILKRLAKLEKQIARARKRDTEVSEMNTKITQAVEGVAAMRRAVDNVQLMQQEIYDIRSKVKQFELESRKLQHLTNRVTDLENNLKIRCRTPING